MNKISQKRFLQGRREAEIMDKGRVKFTHKTIRTRTEEIFSLFDLDVKFDRYLERPYRFITMAVLLLSIGIPIFMNDSTPDNSLKIIAIFLLFVPAAICVLMFFKKTVNLVIIRNRHNGKPAFFLWQDKPTSEACNEFLDTLEAAIDKVRINPESTSEQKILACKQAIELLFSLEVLSPEEANEIFSRAKDQLTNKKKAQLYSV